MTGLESNFAFLMHLYLYDICRVVKLRPRLLVKVPQLEGHWCGTIHHTNSGSQEVVLPSIGMSRCLISFFGFFE